jgi:hypothetical protein
MNNRQWSAMLGGALFLGSFGLVQGLSAAAASAAPAGTAVISSHSVPADPRDYRKGYRDGIKAGREDGEENCERDNAQAFHSGHHHGGGNDQDEAESDYQRGFDAAYEKAFDAAYEEYCS